ncbi:hypothetical protein PCAR4_30025 [Paraburkholderia caribensis]|nr:hypothetical protein PCAR4_30025 [Paraburkholderia caribensis]
MSAAQECPFEKGEMREQCDEGGAGRVRKKKAGERPDARFLTFYFRGPILRDMYVRIVTACPTRGALCARAHIRMSNRHRWKRAQTRAA